MRRTRARGFDRTDPHGVAHGFQITSHKSEPFRCRRNLFSNNCWSFALVNEPPELGPDMSLVGETLLLSGDGKWLARTGSADEGAIVGPTDAMSRVSPAAQSREIVLVDKFSDIVGGHFLNRAAINVAGPYQTLLHQVFQPFAYVFIGIVVIRPTNHNHPGVRAL
jgi:hypothetical protein